MTPGEENNPYQLQYQNIVIRLWCNTVNQIAAGLDGQTGQDGKDGPAVWPFPWLLLYWIKED